jgi:lipoprotein-anchoring transpeptidase ErfK/SrfK
MRMTNYRSSRRSNNQQWVFLVVGAAVVALVIWMIIQSKQQRDAAQNPSEGDVAQAPEPGNSTPQNNTNQQNSTGQNFPRPDGQQLDPVYPGQDPAKPIFIPQDYTQGNGLSAEDALARYGAGIAQFNEGQYLDARNNLSAALLSYTLPPDRAEIARKTLARLADITLFSRQMLVNDPYTLKHVIQPGQSLAGIERDYRLHVPDKLIARINGISDAANQVRAGDEIKLIQGAFHAVVDKSDLTMDIILHREGLEPVYITRMPVGLGRNGSTPAGLWRIELGGKVLNPPWTPPMSAGMGRQVINQGQPGYGFGDKGIWIRIQGMDTNTAGLTGYGIHSTNDPSSIGRTDSLGCIRMLDDDIEFVNGTLYEYWSTVRITP